MYPNDVAAGEHLKRFSTLLLLGLAVLWSMAGEASASQALAAHKGCLGCHDIERSRVGPAFQQVARRYAGQPGAVQRLAEKIRQGGQGQWGVAVMPAHPRLAPEETRLLAEWVLGLPPPGR